MKGSLTALSRRYKAALQRHLQRTPPARPQPALRLGRQAVALGLETLELARIHELALLALEISCGAKGLLKRAERFFTEALIPIVERHYAAWQSRADLKEPNQTLGRRTAELAATNRRLQRDILRRQRVEAALELSSRHYTRLLEESRRLQEGLRQLAHRVLAAQEDERENLRRELQDDIAQTLLGINVRLVSLKQAARLNTRALKNKIASTQRLALKSAQSVRRAARKVRIASGPGAGAPMP